MSNKDEGQILIIAVVIAAVVFFFFAAGGTISGIPGILNDLVGFVKK